MLCVWLGAVVCSGTFAATVFPTMKAIDPRLPAFEKYEGPHYLIAGGKLAQKIFLLADIAQFACGWSRLRRCCACSSCSARTRSAAGRATSSAPFRSRSRSPALPGEIIVVGPALNGALRLYWAAAEAGDNVLAAKHKAGVDDLHPIASWLLSGAAISLLIAFVAGLWTITRPWEKVGDAGPSASPYPEPTLLRKST